jgi:iron complex transport system ATP-binding protein
VPAAAAAGRRHLPAPATAGTGVGVPSGPCGRVRLDGPVPTEPADTDVVLRMDGVGLRRGKSHLLRDVSWTVELDERWVVLGPNGAGKTTLLQLAAAELHPTTGRA